MDLATQKKEAAMTVRQDRKIVDLALQGGGAHGALT